MTRLRNDVPTLINTCCIAHQEALFGSDGFKTILELLILDQYANKLYEWAGRSSNQWKQLEMFDHRT